MTLETIVSLVAVAISGAALIYSRHDVRTKEERQELDDFREQIRANANEILRLKTEVKALEQENRRLREENADLMRRVLDHQEQCATCWKTPIGKYAGPERRKKPRD